MMRYRKKPVEIEAWQASNDMSLEELQERGLVLVWINYLNGLIVDEEPKFDCYRRGLAIKTLEGWREVSPDDYVITGINGEQYPCKPDIFEETYEVIGDGTT